MLSDDGLHAFMLSYQARYGTPPLLAEIAATFPSLGYRSSAYYAVHRLVSEGRVAVTGDPATQRRYTAL
jgi:hypothetical protein